MKADQVTLTDVFSRSACHVVPLYQRAYRWSAENWHLLWEDVMTAAIDIEESWSAPAGQAPTSFLGAIVLEEVSVAPRRIQQWQVIDGQQRLTTLQVLLAAARDVAIASGDERVASQFADLIDNKANLVQQEHPEDSFKVWPSSWDAQPFRFAVRGEIAGGATEPGGLVVDARRWFDQRVSTWVSEAQGDGSSSERSSNRLEALSLALRERMLLVEIRIEDGEDAQLIFETLNDRGERLLASDLVKNTLFRVAAAQHEGVSSLYESYWRALETSPWTKDATTGRIFRNRLDMLIAHWLTIRSGAEVSVEHLFRDFKRWLKLEDRSARDVMADIADHAAVYERLEQLPFDAPVARAWYRLRATNTTTPIPLILHLHQRADVPEDQRTKAVAAIDSFLIRRQVASHTTKDYNNLFLLALTLAKAAPGERVGDTVVEVLAGQTAVSRHWPSNDEFRQALLRDGLYRRLIGPRIRTLMEGIEDRLRSGAAEQLAPTPLTIEHVLPREWREHWPLPDGTDQVEATRQRNELVDSIGNLTLLTQKLNSTVSNGPWVAKRSALHSHSLTALTTRSVLNAPEGQSEILPTEWASAWDEERIKIRGDILADKAIEAWPRPSSPAQSVAPSADEGVTRSSTVTEGEMTCRACGLSLPVTKFPTKRSGTGRDDRCRECRDDQVSLEGHDY